MSAPHILATGRCLPDRVVTNQELSQTVDTSDEWVYSRTGIRCRHFCGPETGLDLAVEAARQKWLDEAAEAERMKKLTPEQKAAEEQQKKDEEIASLRSRLLQKELQETAVRSLEAEGFPAGLAGLIDCSSKERMEETLKSATEIFKESLASAVKSRLKGKTPEGLGGAVSADALLRAQIEKNIMG